jgi:iron complex transport system substrate-binding protein
MKHFYLAFILLLFAFVSCNPAAQKKTQSNHERKVSDMSGRTVIIPKEIRKIIALKSGALRLITYLEATDKVIGIEENERRRKTPYLFAHPKLRELPIFGSGNAPEPELIAALRPDLIICTHNTIGEADKLQQKTGVPVINIKYGDFNQNIDTFFKTLKFLGNILNKERKANQLKKYIKTSIIDLNKRSEISSKTNKKKVYIGGISYRGSHGINSTEPMYAPFRFLNACNVAASLGEVTSSPKAWLKNAFIDKEQLIKWNPDKIFLDVSGFELLKNDLASGSVLSKLLCALQNNEVYLVLPHNWYDINYENILINAYYIGKILYPENFSDIDLADKADEIYKHFLGASVYYKMLNITGGCRKYKKTK